MSRPYCHALVRGTTMFVQHPSVLRPIFAVALLVCWVSPSVAQTFKPTLTPTGPTKFVLNDQDLADDDPIELSWNAQFDVLADYEFDIRLESDALVSLEKGDNEGNPILGLTSVEVVPSAIFRGAEESTAIETVIVRVFVRGSRSDSDTSNTLHFDFELDREGPTPPTIVEAIAGENRVTLKWQDAPEVEDDEIANYEVRWDPLKEGGTCLDDDDLEPIEDDEEEEEEEEEAESDAEAIENGIKARWPQAITGIPSTQTEIVLDDGLRVGRCAEVVIFAFDEAGNRGVSSNVVYAKPVNVYDFWDHYLFVSATDSALEDSGEDGGFCFVATAVHGSYAHPTVQVFRSFRDLALTWLPLGDAVVWSYYQTGGPAAAAIGEDAQVSVAFRFLLTLMAVVAGLLLLLPAIGFSLLARSAVRHRGHRGKLRLFVFLFMLAPTVAEANHGTFRRDRDVTYGFELKGGSYRPAMVDKESAASSAAFSNIFGKAKDRMLTTLGAEINFWRQDWGTLGVYGSIAYAEYVGKGLLTNEVGAAPSRDLTMLRIVPVTLLLTYRYEDLRDHQGIPLVPYVRAGVAYTVWTVTRGDGSVSSGQPTPTADTDQGLGGKAGLVASVGVAFPLEALDERAGRLLHSSSGIIGSGFFGEYYFSWVDGFGGDGFDFSEDSWNVGLYLEF